MKFRKKPVPIEAIQWDGSVRVARQIENWSSDKVRLAYTVLKVPTLEGEMEAKPGDWIIKEPFATEDRKFYPCKPDIFEETYEKVGK